MCRRVAAAKLSIDWPSQQAGQGMERDLYDVKWLPSRAPVVKQVIPAVPACVSEIKRFWDKPFRVPVKGFSRLDVHNMEELGMSNPPPVELSVAHHLNPNCRAAFSSASASMPGRTERLTASVFQKIYPSSALAVRALNATSLLTAYQAELMEERGRKMLGIDKYWGLTITLWVDTRLYAGLWEVHGIWTGCQNHRVCRGTCLWSLSHSRAPFEPIDSSDLKLLSLKTALLLALSTAKRVSELHALSVHNSCMQFTMDYSRVSLKTNPAFVPKVIESALACNQVDLMAFHPPPFLSPEEERLHCLCLVRALHCYVNRTKALRKSNPLFVSRADSHRGKPISRQRLSHWVVEAIIVGYNSMGLSPPEGLRAHSTWGLATSWALFKGVSIQDICAAASWASPHIFVRFYRLDVTEPSLAYSILSV